MIWTGVGVLAAGAGTALLLFSGPAAETAPSGPPPAPKHYPDFSASDHTEVPVTIPGTGDLIVGAHEITMESYRLFLDQWSRLTPELKEKYSHPDQPDKQNATHVPSDWEAMWKAASTPRRQMEGKEDHSPFPRRQRHFLGCLGLCRLETRGVWGTALPAAFPPGMDGSGGPDGNGRKGG